MSVTYGFYNARNHDRRYNAIQISSIFDGIIQDGIYMSIGDHLNVKANSGMMVTVGTGRAWFNHTWTLNDSLLPVELPLSEVILNRIDAVVLEVNADESVRANAIKVVKGEPAANPARPVMVKTNTINQYPLAYISVKAGVTEIRQADITNMVGTSSTPFVTGVMQTMNIDSLIAQWEDQWEKLISDKQTNFNEWFSGFKGDLEETSGELNQWVSDKKIELNTWLSNLQTLLDGNVAANLAGDILDIKKKFSILEREHCLYQNLEGSDSEAIIDSYGTVIEGDIVFEIFGSRQNSDITVSGGGYSETVLWEGEPSNTIGTVYDLSDNIANYDYLMIEYYGLPSDVLMDIIVVDSLLSVCEQYPDCRHFYVCPWAEYYIGIQMTGPAQLTINETSLGPNGTLTGIFRIKGIKRGGSLQ